MDSKVEVAEKMISDTVYRLLYGGQESAEVGRVQRVDEFLDSADQTVFQGESDDVFLSVTGVVVSGVQSSVGSALHVNERSVRAGKDLYGSDGERSEKGQSGSPCGDGVSVLGSSQGQG